MREFHYFGSCLNESNARFHAIQPVKTLWLTLVLCVTAGCVTQSVPSEAGPGRRVLSSEVKHIADLAAVVSVLQAGSGATTLLVLDIDDTLLTSPVFFASDSWYEWQKSLSADDPGKVACRFDVIAMNYEAGTQVPTQSDGPGIVNSIAVDKVILTSRSPGYRGATIRELRHAGYSLPASLSNSDDGVTFRWLQDPSMQPVDVSYDDGVYMVSGQDKGALLLELLRRVNRRFERVILVDDGLRNIEAMRIAMQQANVGYIGLHYTRIDKTVSAEQAKEGVQGWQAWRRFLAGTFPQRLERMDAGDCAY